MTYAVDSNVILDVLYDDPTYAQASIDALSKASQNGELVACEVVWAEASSAMADALLFKAKMVDFGIAFSPMTESAALKAGEIWKLARSRQKQRTMKVRKQVIPDFLVGAHALEKADALITRDRGFLRDYFSTLTIIDPSLPGAAHAGPVWDRCR